MPSFPQTQCCHNVLHDECGICEWREFDKPNSIGKTLRVQEFCCDLERKPCFARATCASEREQTRRFQQLPYFCHLVLAPDETGQLSGEIMGWFSVAASGRQTGRFLSEWQSGEGITQNFAREAYKILAIFGWNVKALRENLRQLLGGTASVRFDLTNCSDGAACLLG